jgi:hypothetical protein
MPKKTDQIMLVRIALSVTQRIKVGTCVDSSSMLHSLCARLWETAVYPDGYRFYRFDTDYSLQGLGLTVSTTISSGALTVAQTVPAGRRTKVDLDLAKLPGKLQEDVNITLTLPAHDGHVPMNATKTQVFLRAPPLCRSTMSRQACCSKVYESFPMVGGGMLNTTEEMHNVTALSMAQDGITFISKGGLRMNRECMDEGNEGSCTC